MTFCGGETAEEGLEIPGKGKGVEIGWRTGSLLPFRDFRRDFMAVKSGEVYQARSEGEIKEPK
jgi:hypothetical protein